MNKSPPRPDRPSPAGGFERPPFQFGGLLGSLIDAGHGEDAREVVEIYLEEHLARLADLFQAVEQGDQEACRHAAHSLVGSAGGIGATDLAATLSSIQDACRKGDLTAVKESLPSVKVEGDRVLLAAQEFLAQEPLKS